MSGGATGGVQNYKGVMLCNRPADDAPPTVNPAVEAPRFRPGGLASEPIGLNPAKENLVSNMLAVEAEAARRRAEDPERLAPDTVMTKHKRWLAEMARKKAALNAELAESAARAAANRKVFEAYSKTLRQAVRERTVELAEAGVPHLRPKMVVAADGTRVRDPDPALSPPANPAAAPAAAAAAAAAAPAAPSSRPPSSSGGGASKKKKKAPPKPKWAMTETEADDIEEEEAAALVDFASGLDYDKYMDDLEVKQALTVIRERIDKQKAAEAAMNTAAEAEAEAEEELAIALGEAGDDWRTKFLQSWNEAAEEDDDEAAERASVVSSTTSVRRKAAAAAAEGEQPEWDSSTKAGEERARPPSAALEAAAELMQSNPKLAAKHSLRSLASAVGSAMAKSSAGQDVVLPPLRLVTIHENPRVTADKSTDPSNLPYLHRNPAV